MEPGLVIISPPLPGKDNMAIDEALLECASPEWPTVLRIYQWDRPTVSLGRFQSLADMESDPKLRSLDWVRRKTGGGAIVHDRELTYSVLMPARQNVKLKGHSEILYRSIHNSILSELVQLGWDAKLSESCTCQTGIEQKAEPFLCFLRRSPVDLLASQHKILGSAQRRTATGLLQHGSFLISHSLASPQLLGIADLPNLADFHNDCGDSAFWTRKLIRWIQFGMKSVGNFDWNEGVLEELPGFRIKNF
jgi:lipoyl(octanoyl) transferase